jgi:hypothetical protein
LAAAAFPDTAYSSCGFSYSPHDFLSQESDTFGSASVTCADARFGQIGSQAYVSGTRFGAKIVVDWNGNPPARLPPDNQMSAMARAQLYDSFTVPGTGWGSMTMAVPIHGLMANSPYFNFLASVFFQAGNTDPGDGSTFWRTDFQQNGAVGQTFNVTLSVPLGQAFTFYGAMYIWGGATNGGGASYTDAVANFMDTVEVSVTRLQDGTGTDIPLGSLQVASGRPFAISPVPEAQTWCLMAAGLAMFGALGARRRGAASSALPPGHAALRI